MSGPTNVTSPAVLYAPPRTYYVAWRPRIRCSHPIFAFCAKKSRVPTLFFNFPREFTPARGCTSGPTLVTNLLCTTPPDVAQPAATTLYCPLAHSRVSPIGKPQPATQPLHARVQVVGMLTRRVSQLRPQHCRPGHGAWLLAGGHVLAILVRQSGVLNFFIWKECEFVNHWLTIMA